VNRIFWAKRAPFGMAGEERVAWTLLPVRAAASGGQAGQSRRRAPRAGVPHYRFRAFHSLPIRRLAQRGGKSLLGPARINSGPGRPADQRATAGTARASRRFEAEIDAEWLDAVSFAVAAPGPDPSELTRYICGLKTEVVATFE